jgi:uncharacterized membrane-anchored protein
MPDGPEKDKRLTKFYRDLQIGMWSYAIMALIMLGMTVAVIVAVLVKSL